MTDDLTLTWCGLALLCFVLGVCVGNAERAERRAKRRSPAMATPALPSYLGMRSERR